MFEKDFNNEAIPPDSKMRVPAKKRWTSFLI